MIKKSAAAFLILFIVKPLLANNSDHSDPLLLPPNLDQAECQQKSYLRTDDCPDMHMLDQLPFTKLSESPRGGLLSGIISTTQTMLSRPTVSGNDGIRIIRLGHAVPPDALFGEQQLKLDYFLSNYKTRTPITMHMKTMSVWGMSILLDIEYDIFYNYHLTPRSLSDHGAYLANISFTPQRSKVDPMVNLEVTVIPKQPLPAPNSRLNSIVAQVEFDIQWKMESILPGFPTYTITDEYKINGKTGEIICILRHFPNQEKSPETKRDFCRSSNT